MSSIQQNPTAPAFTNLLDAYARWQDFEHVSAQATLSPSNVPVYDEHTHLPVPTPASAAFIMNCPYIDVPDLPEDQRICHLCTDPYNYLSDRAKDIQLKIAQRLPCRHYVCNFCLPQWLDPTDESNNNTCPFDRTVLFPKFSHFLNTRGMQERSDLLDWLNGARGRHPTGAERDGTARLKALLVERHLGAAVEELDRDRSDAAASIRPRLNARAIDIDGAAVLLAHHAELLHFTRRLTTLGAIAESVEERVRIPTLRARLQRTGERLAGDRGWVQEMWDAVNGVGGAEGGSVQ